MEELFLSNHLSNKTIAKLKAKNIPLSVIAKNLSKALVKYDDKASIVASVASRCNLYVMNQEKEKSVLAYSSLAECFFKENYSLLHEMIRDNPAFFYTVLRKRKYIENIDILNEAVREVLNLYEGDKEVLKSKSKRSKFLYLVKHYCMKRSLPKKYSGEHLGDSRFNGNKKRVKKRKRIAVENYCPSGYEKRIFFNSNTWKGVRYKVLRRDGGVCSLCGRGRCDGVILHVDHIKPISKNWNLRDDIDNLQVLCEDCNIGKSNKYEDKWN
ncbi:HNH endonuclease [Halobacteriovorax sp. CON-3]|uniref:HNH endonuclease n=1 Tax=Halobacteriovorax sp. CON-3 TaxID=3157710 RepID=UPI003720A96B